jgi:hypothetical protein
MHKLSHLVDDEWVEHSFAPVFAIGDKRITGGVPAGESSTFEDLVACMSEPIALLYVLHTPRGEAPAGRYRSPQLGTSEFRDFIQKYRTFLSGDARFDIWAHSREDNATVVWDRHNKFFAYGPVEKFASQLRAMGFHEGAIKPLGEHMHHYREEFDPLARALIDEYQWTYSPLRAEDEQ